MTARLAADIGGTFGCFSCMTLGGKDPQSDGEFAHFECYSGGWGGRHHADGNSATVSLGSGDAYNIPVEVMETTTPILLCEKFALQEGSAGAGRHRGGFGPPVERDPALVAEDCLNGLITVEDARTRYCVAIDPGTFAPDFDATAALRRARRGEDGSSPPPAGTEQSR